jgi:hypothetical protein
MLALLAGAGVPLPDNPVIRRTHAGRHQRAAGAWVWRVDNTDDILPATLVGGWDPVTYLVAQPCLVAQEFYGEIVVVAGGPSKYRSGLQWVLLP